MEALQILSRNEMKDITAGSADCQWSSCKTTSSYYNCLSSMCLVWYDPGQAQIDCVNTAGAAHISMMGECGIQYQ